MAYEKLTYTNSDELCERMAQECDTCLLSFSCGKDSVASWLQCRKYFKHIIPYYRYLVPNMDFVNDNIKYYEDFFGQHIYQFPSPNFYRLLRDGVFQSKERWDAICANSEDLPTSEYTELLLADALREIGNIPENAYCAVGNRASDSPMRRMSISKSGAVNHNKKTFFPVYDWLQDRLLKEMDDAGVKFATDYQVWSNTFDSLSYKYLSKMRDAFPEDYKRCLEYFPMCELEFWRRGER